MCLDGIGPRINVDLKADLTKACDEIAGATPKGFRKITHLLFGKHDADVIRYKVLTTAQTQVDLQKVLAGQLEYRKGELQLVEPAVSSLESQFLQHESEQELSNVAGNTRIALEVLKNVPDDQIADEDVSPDFFARWRREAKVIGDKELQNIWGRLLAEEVKTPNSVSYRALDVIKNLSPIEAQFFIKIAPFIIEGVLVCLPHLNNYPGGINTSLVLAMDEAGLLIHGNGIMKTNITKSTSSGEPFVYLNTGKLAIGEFRYAEKISITGLMITKPGEQILSICDADFFCADRAAKLWSEIGKYIEPKNGFFRIYEIGKDRTIGEPICEADRS